MFAIYVRSTRAIRYAIALTHGYKAMETRTRNVLKRLIGQRVAVIETGRGKAAIVGYLNIDSCDYIEKERFDKMHMFHCVPSGSKYDCKKGSGKYCYWVSDPVPCDPFPVPENAIKHGRSYCEF